jgi:iron complex outermembrane recepter protein
MNPLTTLRSTLLSFSVIPLLAVHAGAQSDTDAADSGVIFTLPAFTVETTSEDGKVALSASLGAMRTAEKLEEIPVTVAVIPQEIMEAFQLYDPDEHAAYVASWLSGETEEGGGGGSRLRGFVPTTYRNGFTRTGVGEVVNIERTEVIKGPISAMFGQANPGGLINYVTRRARSEPSYRIVGIFGSDSFERYQGHFTGPLVKDKLFYRLDGSYNYQEGQQDFWYNRTWAVSGNLVYRISPSTTVYFDVETLNRYMNRGTGGVLNLYPTFFNPVLNRTITSVIGGINEELVRSGFNQHGPDAKVEREIVTYDLRLEHQFNRSFSLRANLQYWDRTFDDYRWTTPQYNVSTGLFAGREPFRHYQPENSLSGQIDLLSKFWFGKWAENELLLTFDFSDYTYLRQDWRMVLAERNKLPTTVRNLDPLNPDYGSYDRGFMTRLTTHEERDASLYGLMVRERLALMQGDLILFASARYDRVENDVMRSANNNGLAFPIAQFQTVGAARRDLFSGSFGGNYKLRGNQLIAFANVSSSYVPLTDLDLGTGELQEPERGTGYEAGFRGRIYNDTIYWTASVYQIDRHDIPQRNPEFEGVTATPGVAQFIGAGEERSKGFEFEANGDPTRNFSFRVSFGYNDAYLTRFPDFAAMEGRKLLRAPEITASFMLIYRIREGGLRGTTLGFSGRYTDRYYARFGGAGSYVSGTNTVTFVPEQPWELLNRIEEIRPSTTIYNLFVQKGFRLAGMSHTARLNVLNLFDTDEWTVTGRVKPGREYRLSWSVSF